MKKIQLNHIPLQFQQNKATAGKDPVSQVTPKLAPWSLTSCASSPRLCLLRPASQHPFVNESGLLIAPASAFSDFAVTYSTFLMRNSPLLSTCSLLFLPSP